MWRVKVLVEKILVHVAGKDLFVRFVVKKGRGKQEFYRLYRMAGYECTLNAQIEFYLDSVLTGFTIVALLVNQERDATKMMGEVTVQLNGENGTIQYSLQSKLEKCPDAQATITYKLQAEEIDNFIDMNKPLLNQNEVDYQYYLKQIKELREQLSTSEQLTKRSQQQAERLAKQQAQELEKIKLETKQSADQAQKTIDSLQEQLRAAQQERQSYKEDLMNSKKRLADIVDILNEVGDATVLERIESLMSE